MKKQWMFIPLALQLTLVMVMGGCGDTNNYAVVMGSGQTGDIQPGDTPPEESQTATISGRITVGSVALDDVAVVLSGSSSKVARTDSSGNYSFTGVLNGSCTLTPSKTGYTFSPTGQTVTIVGDNVTEKNFAATAVVANTAPVANAGAAQTVAIGSVATLDGSASSDADGDPLTYSWSFSAKPMGSSATLSNATVVKPTFVLDLPGAYTLKLMVKDGLVYGLPAYVAVTSSLSTGQFVDKGNGTIYDTVSKLIWLKDANCFNLRTWENALSKADALADGQCGLSDGTQAGDWHLPTVAELRTFVDDGYLYNTLNYLGFINVQYGHYWTADSSTTNTANAWSVSMVDGRVRNDYKKNNSLYMWPVRPGQ